MMPGKPGGGVNIDEALWMRSTVLKHLIMYKAENQVLIFTGSTMAIAWMSLARMPKNGHSALLTVKPLMLPSDFSSAHMQASLVSTANSRQACQAVRMSCKLKEVPAQGSTRTTLKRMFCWSFACRPLLSILSSTCDQASPLLNGTCVMGLQSSTLTGTQLLVQ